MAQQYKPKNEFVDVIVKCAGYADAQRAAYVTFYIAGLDGKGLATEVVHTINTDDRNVVNAVLTARQNLRSIFQDLARILEEDDPSWPRRESDQN